MLNKIPVRKEVGHESRQGQFMYLRVCSTFGRPHADLAILKIYDTIAEPHAAHPWCISYPIRIRQWKSEPSLIHCPTVTDG